MAWDRFLCLGVDEPGTGHVRLVSNGESSFVVSSRYGLFFFFFPGEGGSLRTLDQESLDSLVWIGLVVLSAVGITALACACTAKDIGCSRRPHAWSKNKIRAPTQEHGPGVGANPA